MGNIWEVSRLTSLFAPFFFYIRTKYSGHDFFLIRTKKGVYFEKSCQVVFRISGNSEFPNMASFPNINDVK